MGIEPAIAHGWEIISDVKLENTRVRFLADEFAVHVKDKKVLSLSRKVPAEDCLTVLILHYFAKMMKGLPAPTGEWFGLSGLSVAEGFADVFEKRVADLIVKKYGSDPDSLYQVLKKMPGKKIEQADAAIVLEVFESVPVLIMLWRADEEFGAEGKLLFDKSITRIFCAEDILVLAEMVAAAI